MIVADDYNHFNNSIINDVMSAGTHAHMGGYLSSQLLDIGRWYRSKEKLVGNNPYPGYLTNKKWHLNEVKVKDD